MIRILALAALVLSGVMRDAAAIISAAILAAVVFGG